MDPHSVLGVAPGASPDEVTAAYRRLAKAHHPDRSGADTKQIRDINAAYALLRDGLAARATPVRPQAPRPWRSEAAGAWLAPAVRMALGAELLGALEPGEQVRHVAAAATWDAHDVRLVLTDRRLLWLRDDALTDRVRSLRLADLAGVEARRARRGRSGELRVRVREGRRQDFAELRPESLAALERALQAPSRNADT